MEDEGNAKLRALTQGQARELFKRTLTNDPATRECYRRWCDDHEEQKKTMGASYRACEKGGRAGNLD